MSNENYAELYKRLRPRTWDDMVGQESVTKGLRAAVASGKLPTVYGFFGTRGCGKALHQDTLIPMASGGFKTMLELAVGDTILGSFGQPVTVTAKYCPNDPSSYLVTFSDDTQVFTSGGHLWETVSITGGRAVVTTESIFATTHVNDENGLRKPNHAVLAIREAVAYENGKTVRSDCASLDSGDTSAFDLGSQLAQDAVTGLIPDEVLYSAHSYREQVLEGLLNSLSTTLPYVEGVDTPQIDGDDVRFTLSDVDTANSLTQLLNSLGLVVSVAHGNTRSYVSFTLRYDLGVVTDLVEASGVNHSEAFVTDSLSVDSHLRWIVDVEDVSEVMNPSEFFCISVDSDDSLFLFSEAYIPTHNTSAAFIMAKAVNCENPDNGAPCNNCDICRAIDDGTQVGVNYISMANNGSVDDVRKIMSDANRLQPVKRQVWILDEAHNLSKAAFDSMLIPFESSNSKVMFIMCSTEQRKVPDTILSRTQSRNFVTVNAQKMLEYLNKVNIQENLGLSESALKDAVRIGRGSVRDTLTAIERVIAGETVEIFKDHDQQLVMSMAARNPVEALKTIDSAIKAGWDARALGDATVTALRDVLLAGNGMEDGAYFTRFEPQEAFLRLRTNGCLNAIGNFADALAAMANGSDPRVFIEGAVIKSIRFLKRMDKQKQ